MSVALPRTIVSESGEPGTIRAVLLDPGEAAMTITWIDLPTLRAEPGRWGTQLAPDEVVALIGKRVNQHQLHAGEVLLVGEGEGPGWRVAGCDLLHRGRGLVLGYDRISDAYADSRFGTLDQVAALLTFEPDDAEGEEEEADGTKAA
jgi:hypothetical protein